MDFDALVTQAEAEPFSGWDFSWLRGRWREGHTSWDFGAMVRERFAQSDALLDMGTGGGEFLASLAPLPARTVATEGYPPNVEVARKRLEPLGVQVIAYAGAPDNVDIAPGEGIGTLPFPDASFPLIMNRHESYAPAEIERVLAPGGVFLTQQVGGRHNAGLNEALGAPSGFDARWNLGFARRQLRGAGLQVVSAAEEFPETWFADVGSVVYYLKAIPWAIPNFTVKRYRDRLLALHERMIRDGGLRIRARLFVIEARYEQR
jgi:SAM-dependent methyltransferase